MKNIKLFSIIGMLMLTQQVFSQKNVKSVTMNKTEEHYTFQLSDKVSRQKVSFKNRYGIILSGDLYLPKNAGSKKMSALAISGPFGAVKEQSSGLYANEMAQRGFAVIAFDPSYTGESSGETRSLASPEINTEDFSAAVDFLGIQKNIDRNKIGIIGICGFGGFALNAAAVDKRVKAVAVSTMYDMTRVMSKGYNDAVTLDQRTKILEQLGEQRWKDAESGSFAPGPVLNAEKLKGDEPQFVKEYHDYYKTERGFHERSLNSTGAWNATTPISFMNMPIMTYIKEISPRPILIIAGEKAHSRYFSEDAFKAAAQPKELVIVPGAVHTDLYDKLDKIPFDTLENFFKTNLK
ncbi:membrane protein [Chryseobacterium soli]|uniref:Membrane protein n=2 Tax=Chryseobacterium soli TaxID=445961 RepID=A0A086A1K5_9FLAO|nr:alpha/beta hydrolase [Chryseobacterium soli]KFF10569.1 membrane protein [Chryseobacterium soli]